jgi:hypothetical protein
MPRKVPKRNESNGISRRQALGLVGTVVGGGGVLAGLQQSTAFTTADTDRDSQVDIKQDSNAIVPITGKTADITPEFGNKFGTGLTITLSAPNESSAGFDVGMTGRTESTTEFTIPPGKIETVGMDADISPISVVIDGVHENGEVSLTRDFDIPAVTVDTVSSLDGGQGNSFTLNHIVGSGDNRAIYVFVQLMDTSTSREVRMAEFNGNSMTEVVNIARDIKMQVFRLINPTSGSGTVSLELTGNRENKVGIGVISFENVDQGTPEDPASTATSQGNSATLSGISTTGVDLVVDGIATDKSITGPGADQIDQWRAAAEAQKQSGGSTADVKGSVDMSWSFNSGKYTHVGFNLNNEYL